MTRMTLTPRTESSGPGPRRPPADQRPLVAGVDVLDLEVAGGVLDEPLPRAELRVIALVAGAVGGRLDALHDAVGGDDVLEEGGVPLLERPVEAVDDLVGRLGHDRGAVLGGGWGLTLSRFRGHGVPRRRVKVSRRSVGRDHRTDLIGCGPAPRHQAARCQTSAAAARVALGPGGNQHVASLSGVEESSL